MMSITGGKWRGQLIHCPRVIRPTTGRVKEYIFSQVGQRCLGARALDLFAGSGALGIEALSRDGRDAVFVDVSKQSLRTVKKNLAKFNLQCEFILADALRFVRNFQGEPFDIVFLDPPYDDFPPDILIESIGNSSILNEEAYVVQEMAARGIRPECESLINRSFKQMGDTAVGIWRRPGLNSETDGHPPG